jgi:predicted Zn-dependent protease
MNWRKWGVGTVLSLVVFTLSLVWQRHAVANFLVFLGSPRLAGVAMKTGLNFNEEYKGSYPIIKAVQAGDEEMVRYLIAAKVNVNVGDQHYATPLIWAIRSQQSEIAADLIAAGADVNAIDSSGWSALRHAVHKGRADLAEQLIKAGANVNSTDNRGLTPLMQAAAADNTQIAQLLLSKGADLTVLDMGNHPALDYLPQKHDPFLAQMLKKVYFVPIGESPAAEIQELVSYYHEKFGLEINVLPALRPQPNDIDAGRKQLIAENVIASMVRAYPDYARNRALVLIGITDYDIYPRSVNWQFVFGWREFQSHAAIASTARMNLHYFGEPQDQATVSTRLRKVVTKDLGLMVFEKLPNNNPKSVLYDGIGGIQELDEVSEDF